MPQPSLCPRCHAELPPGAGGAADCPQCLLRMGIGEGAPAAPGAGLAGAQLGPYRVGELLGAGGMGHVYEAVDTRLDRHVALKVLAPEVATDPDRLRRFRREARTVAALNHPAIVTVHSIEEIDGLHFLTMERVEGRTVDRLIPPGGMPLGLLVAVALPLAEALEAAHEAGVVHRDLKPANVMVERSGRVKLLDFSLALRDGRPLAGGDGSDALRTRAGLILGTLPYLSPEQVQGRRADERSDRFSFGVLLHEMATGSRPFGGDSAPELFAAILRDEAPPLLRERPDLPAGLGAMVARLLAKDPEGRPGSTAEVVAVLRGLAEDLEEGVAAGPPAPAAASPEPASASGVPTAPLPAHEIRFCTTSDGVRIAFASAGEGTPLVKTANWLNHLEYDWRSPVWRPWLAELTRRHRLVRYDERGNGLSDWDVGELSVDAFVRDLETVVDAVGLGRFPLFAISQGCAVAVAYAVRHPDRVTRLVLYGGFARGWAGRGAESRQWGRAFRTLIRQGWGRRHPALRQALVPLFAPAATPEQAAWFEELHRVSTSPENAVRLWDAFGELDVTSELGKVAVPTLVVHCRDDALVSFRMGHEMAAAIPGARFLLLDSANHLLLPGEPAWDRLLPEIESFLAAEGAG